MPEQTNIPSNPEIISNMQHEGIVTEPLLPGYPRFPMLMFSSSHMTEHHHFKEALQDVWTTRFNDNPCFFVVVVVVAGVGVGVAVGVVAPRAPSERWSLKPIQTFFL